MLDKGRWERNRRVCFEHGKVTKSESAENDVQSEVVKKTVRAVKKTVSFKKFYSVI